MTKIENTSTPNKSIESPLDQVDQSKRRFLKQTAAVFAAMPFSQDLLKTIFLPKIEAPLSPIEQQKKSVLESLLKIFPNMTSVDIEADDTNIDGYIKCLNFWIDKFRIFLRNAQATIQDSGLEHSMYQTTVEEVNIIFGKSSGRTVSHLDGSEITKQELYGQSNDPASITAEIIHLFQATTSIQNGVSSLILEGASTAIDQAALEFWRKTNDSNNELGNFSWIQQMPIFDISSGARIEEPSFSQFRSFLNDMMTYTDILSSRALAKSYKKQFLGEDKLGQSQEYPSSGSFLFDRLDLDTFPPGEYRHGIENQALLVYEVLSSYELFIQDMVILCGFLNHGQDIGSLYGVTQPIVDAYNELKAKNLIASKEVWQKNIEKFSQNTIGEQAANVAFALRSTEAGSNKHLTLEAYLVLTRIEMDEAYFDALYQEDLPTALLYFPVNLDGNGVLTWYQKEVEVKPSKSDRTLFYDIELPDSVLIRSGIKVWYEQLKDKDMVLRVTQPTILGVDLNTFQDFEVKGEYPVSIASTPEVTEQDEVTAISDSLAPTVLDTVQPKKYAYSDLSPANQTRLDEIKAQLEKRSQEKSRMTEPKRNVEEINVAEVLEQGA